MSPAGLRRDAQRNRERLLDAARGVFAAEGLDGSLEEIARRAGVSAGTVYNQFGGRAALVDAALVGRVEETVALAETALAHPDPWEGFVGYVVGLAAAQAGDRGFTEICVRSFPADSAIERAKARGGPAVTGVLARAQEAGVVRDDVTLADLGLLLWAVVGATDGLRGTEPDAWRRHVALLLDGLRASAAHELPGEPLDDAAVHAAMAWTADTRRR